MSDLGDDDAQDSRKRTAAGRLLSLLGAFSRGGGSLTLSEIARYADLSTTATTA
jgi:DNA-binding IclR family transcriptional regulator